MREYETILKVAPNENEVLLRLGSLYFEHGLSAQGLRLYEKLKNSGDTKKAEELISFYDAALETFSEFS
jgi:lipopolysaccharide biosynthesis regulator YciM